MGQQEHKLLLYADDILLVSSNPQMTVPTMCSLTDDFSQISGYKINWTKSEVMPLSKNCHGITRDQWPFRWVSSGMVYLGIKLIPVLEKMMQINFQPIIQEIRNLLQNWSKLTLSIMGRINLVKMIIAPKINYLSYMLPLVLPPSHLKEYNEYVEYFIWQGKRPLFNRTKLYSAKSSGGLSLPRIDWYHWSFSLSQLAKNNMTYNEAPAWVYIEKELIAPFSSEAFLTQSARPIPDQNPVLKFTRESWKLYHLHSKQTPWLTTRASVWHNTKLRIDKKAFCWIQWANKGIWYLDNLYEGEHVVSFNYLKQTYRLSNTDFWKYLQIRHCLHATLKNGPDPPTDVQIMYAAKGYKKGLGSVFYAYIRGANAPNLNSLKVAWERDLRCAIKEEAWKQVVSKWHANVRETQSQLINYKILNRCYWTPSKGYCTMLAK